MQGTFYLGANTPQGFFSYYDELNNAAKTRKYIIKGGPGTGKSSFMRKFADTAKKGGEASQATSNAVCTNGCPILYRRIRSLTPMMYQPKARKSGDKSSEVSCKNF